MCANVPLGAETVPPNESADIEELLEILRTIQEHADRRKQPVPRTVHPKQHGCVRAELTIEPGLPPELRHGIFREARRYAALVRFSNSKQRDDRLPDGHGMAIKLLGVEGEKLLESEGTAETQDFVLVDHPIFFARNVADFIPLAHDFRRLMLGGPVAKARTILKAIFSWDYRFRLIRKAGAKRPDSVLNIQYWSMTPFRLGDGAAKFSVRPCASASAITSGGSKNKLREEMQARLRQHAAVFEFLVQLQSDPTTMPIEDPTVRWDEAAAPFWKVGMLRLPPQSFDSPAQDSFGEHLSFTPWHGLQQHRPLGGINRARKAIYETMAARRRELNQVSPREPTESEMRALWLQPHQLPNRP
jgi:hypothetical protein